MLNIKVAIWSLGTFTTLSFVLCVIYGLATPESLHMHQFLEIALPAFVWLTVAVVAFLEEQRVVQVTSPVAGYNGFTLEGGHFVGRMEGNGGKVALRFVTPGKYTYSIDHREHSSLSAFAHGLSTVVVLRKYCTVATPVLPCPENAVAIP